MKMYIVFYEDLYSNENCVNVYADSREDAAWQAKDQCGSCISIKYVM